MTEDRDAKSPERRRLERKYLVFYLRIFEGLSTKVLGHVVNISSEGILLLSDEPIRLDVDYRLRMRLPYEVCETGDILFSGVSKWGQKDVNPDFFLTGFEIHDLSQKSKDDILHFLEEYSFLDE